MKTMKKLMAGALALSALAGHQAAWAQDNAEKKCLNAVEAEAMMTVLMPGALKATSKTCQPYLPADAALNQSSTYIDNTLTPAARTAFPTAYSAFKVVAGDSLPDGLGYDEITPLMDLFLGQEIAKGIKPESCAPINTIYQSIETMGPQQSSAMVAAILQLVANSEEGMSSKLPICPSTALTEQ